MGRKYQVTYQSNPNLPIGYDHAGKLSDLLGESTRTFETLDEAITFWSECTNPITELKSFKKALCETCCLSEQEAEEVLSICEDEVFVRDDVEFLPENQLEQQYVPDYMYDE